MPVRATPDDIKKGRASLDELATAAGRDPKTLDVTVFGEGRDSGAIKQFEDAGADRVIVRLSSTAQSLSLAHFALQVLAPAHCTSQPHWSRQSSSQSSPASCSGAQDTGVASASQKNLFGLHLA